MMDWIERRVVSSLVKQRNGIRIVKSAVNSVAGITCGVDFLKVFFLVNIIIGLRSLHVVVKINTKIYCSEWLS